MSCELHFPFGMAGIYLAMVDTIKIDGREYQYNAIAIDVDLDNDYECQCDKGSVS